MSTTPGNQYLTAALTYADKGWNVLPCKPKLKQPATLHGLKDATIERPQIEHWWHTIPQANVAIRCGQVSAGLVVIDVDGEEGKESLKGKKLTPTIMARTGGGGLHYFYFYAGKLRPKVGLLPHVDLRAEDSYVVAPPSLHPSGTRYEWIIGPDSSGVGDLPEWVVELASTPVVEAPQALSSPGKADKSKLGRAALDFCTNGAPKGQQRAAAVAAARNFLAAGYTVEATAHRIWAGFRVCEQDADEPWTFQHASAIAQDLASKPAPPIRPLPPREQVPPASRPASNGRKPSIAIVSAVDLMAKNFPPIRWLIPGLWPEGMALLAAKPKIGKTWLSLDIALAVAYGGTALGKIKVDQGDVLYLALEDGERRIQSRLQALLFDQPPPSRLHFAYNWLRLNEGGIDALVDWVNAHPETRMIVVDTMRRIRPKERVGASSYNQDYDAIAPLADLAHAANVNVVGVSHTRKMGSEDPLDLVSGTLGLTGAADHILVLQRERGQGQAVLHLMGRDVEDKELALLWEAPRWRLLGDAKEIRMSAERKEICDLIKKAGRPMSPKEIADMMGKNPTTVRRLLTLMNMDGTLMNDGRAHYDIYPHERYDTCHCGQPVFVYGTDGRAYCEQHAPSEKAL